MREKSFGQLLDSGVPRAELQDYFCLTDNEYDRVIASLQEIRKNGRKK
jgi:hypothetical protein